MFPRRRPGSGSSTCEPTATNVEPTTPSVSPEAYQTEHALGFTDIYGTLTPRQISIISLYLLPRATTGILTYVRSYWISNWNGFDGWHWKSVNHVRMTTYARRISSVLNDIDSKTGAA
jgi:amino acid transporter